MNDLTIYKIKQLLEGIFTKVISVSVFPFRILYNNNKIFHQWIEKRKIEKREKKEYKNAIQEIAYYLKNNEDHTCIIFFGFQHKAFYPVDSIMHPNHILLKDDFWIKKNKLKVEKHTLESYCNIYYKEEDLINKFYGFSSQKDRTVLIIKKP